VRTRSSPALLALALAMAAPGGAWPEDVAAPLHIPPPPGGPGWLDASHRFVSEGILWSVLRFDRFFSDERELDLPRARSFVRFRSTLTIRDDGRTAYGPDLLAQVVLPNLDRRLERLRLKVETGRARPHDPALSAAALSPDAIDRPHAGLLVSPLVSLLTQVDLQGGLLLHSLGGFGRARIRHVVPVAELLVARLAASGFWQTDTGWGTRQDLDLESPFTSWLLLRLASTGVVTQRSRGWVWSSALGLLAADWPRTALSVSGAALGATRAGPFVETWRLQLRARHDVFRRWIFLEVNPEVVWTRRPRGGRPRASAVMLVLEVQFAASDEPGMDAERLTRPRQGRTAARDDLAGEPVTVPPVTDGGTDPGRAPPPR